MDHHLIIGGWRRLAVRVWGRPDGVPVFLLHGTPGSRLSLRPTDDEIAELNVRLVTYDRPGYGGSHSLPDRSVAQAADDVHAIANAFDLKTFAVLGRSGGGPHALAIAAVLGDRVTRVASLMGLAPYGMDDLDWLEGMADMNRRQYAAAIAGRAQLNRLLYPQVVAIRNNPEAYARQLMAQAADPDRHVLADPEYRRAWLTGLCEAIRCSFEGWAADNLAFTRPWGFDLGAIHAPTLLWHGGRDAFSPVSHARWLARQICDASLHVSDHAAHFQASRIQLGAIRWLMHGGQPELKAS